MQLEIFRNTDLVASPEIDEQTVYSGEFMGVDKIDAVFILPDGVDIFINDYTVYQGKQYKIKHAVNLDEGTGRCEAIFYGQIYDLYDVPLSHLGRTKFSYTGTPLDLLGLLVDNLNDWFPEAGWSIGNVALIDEPITFSFDEVSCRVALSDIAEQFKLEWRLVGKSFYLVESIGILQPIPPLRYGRGMGLQMLAREAVDATFATVWRFYGGNKNIPAGYRDGMDRITTGSLYETNTALYGRKGGSVTFEDVYPRRTSTIETVVDANTVVDTTIDFDIASSYLSDASAKIVFKTGELAGNSFVIIGYDNTTKTIRFGTINEPDTGYQLPNDHRNVAVGDLYTIEGIEMPESYVLAAEAEVWARGVVYASQHNHPPVKFPLIIDEKYIREMGLAFAFDSGDKFMVISETLGVNAALRLQSISWPLVNPCKVDGQISDVIIYNKQDLLRKEVKEAKKQGSDAQKSALYARQAADEIANAAIMHQFKRTYIGDLAIMTGTVVVGNPQDGEVGFISGIGEGEDQIVVGGGSTFADRENAKFKLLRNGHIYSTAGFIGGFKILPGSFESANEYAGGKFVLYPDDGFIAFIDANKGIWSGIGVNTLSVTTGIRAVGRFENKEVNDLGTNYATLAVAENGRNNIAMYAAGNVSVRGAMGSTAYYRFTPTSSNNTLSAESANTALVLVDNATYDTVYLPTVNDLTRAFGIGITADFIVRFTVFSRYDSLDFMLASDYDMRDSDGVLISFVTMAKGDTTEWLIYRESGNTVVQLANRQF